MCVHAFLATTPSPSELYSILCTHVPHVRWDNFELFRDLVEQQRRKKEPCGSVLNLEVRLWCTHSVWQQLLVCECVCFLFNCTPNWGKYLSWWCQLESNENKIQPNEQRLKYDWLLQSWTGKTEKLTHAPPEKKLLSNSSGTVIVVVAVDGAFFSHGFHSTPLICRWSSCCDARLVINLFRAFFLFQPGVTKVFATTHNYPVFSCARITLSYASLRTPSFILTFYGHCLFPLLSHLNISIGKLSSIFYIHLFASSSFFFIRRNLFPACHLACHLFVRTRMKRRMKGMARLKLIKN